MDAGAFGYLSDITSKEKRTQSMALAAGCITMSLTAGYYFSALIGSVFPDDQDQGFCVLLFTSLGIGIIGIFYTIFILEESRPRKEEKTKFFDFSNVMDCFKIVFKVKENRLKKMIACFTFFCVNIGTITTDFEYMMSKKKYSMFKERISMFTIYNGTKQGFDGAVLLIVLPILLQFVHISDQMLILIGLGSVTGGYALIMFSDESWAGSEFGWPLFVLAILYR